MGIGQPAKMGLYVVAITWGLFIFGNFFSNAAAEPTSEKLELKIDELDKQLLNFRNFLSTTETNASEAEKLLRSSEKELNILLNRIETKEISIKKNKNKVALLEKKGENLIAERDLQADLIRKQIRLEYQGRNLDYLKFLLSQEEPAKLSRMNRYFQSLNSARLDQMKKLKISIDQTERVEQELQKYVGEIARDIRKLALEQTTLQQKKEEKKKIAREFQLEIEKTRQKIVNIEKNKETLIAFLSKLRSKELKNEKSWNTQQFSKMKGKLEMPVEGRVLHNFGDNRGTGELKWQGLFIEGERGSPVRSVYPGTVIFSDWFRGLGLLIIIKHGDGFMSLYAHNETLKKNAGEIVNPNDLIATIGNSGGQQKTGVYFEIRVQGKASNPKDWLAEKKVLKLESKGQS